MKSWQSKSLAAQDVLFNLCLLDGASGQPAIPHGLLTAVAERWRPPARKLIRSLLNVEMSHRTGVVRRPLLPIPLLLPLIAGEMCN